MMACTCTTGREDAYFKDDCPVHGDIPSMAIAQAVRAAPVRAFEEPGYELLRDVLSRAFDQAARGKGKERHAQGEPFHEQVMQQGADRFGVGALLFQAFKKSEESQRLPHDAAIKELLGAIVYTAGAVIALERRNQAGVVAHVGV